MIEISLTPENGLDKLLAADTAQTRAVAVSVERFGMRLGILEAELLERVVLGLAALVELPAL